MKAIVISEPGGPDVLQWRDVDDLTPGPGEVLIDVVASAVNRADVMQRQGHYPPPPGASAYPGLECSGRIAAVGAKVAGSDTATDGTGTGDDVGFSVGDEVCALLSGGGYAEQVTVPAGQVLALPPGVDLVEAGGLPEVVCTVWSNVFMAAGLRTGETLLVHGGSSGIGTMAIQLATHVGARVAVTAGSAEKLERCRDLGAEILVNYRDDDFVTAVREATDGHGADVVLDNMGAKYLARNLDVLAFNGRIVIIGMQGGTKAELDIGQLMRKRAALISTSLRARPADEKAAIVGSVREHVWPLLAAGDIRPIIDSQVPMADAAEAHRLLEASDHVGKVLLVR